MYCANIIFKMIYQSTAQLLMWGGGYCEFINNIESHNKYVIDLNQEVLKCANSKVTAFVGDTQSFKKSGLISPENSGINIVFISNFLEHLDSKETVYALIKEVKELLQSGGKILILQPNIKYVGGKYWDFFDHKTPLTESSLMELANMLDLEVVRCVKRFMPYTTKSSLPISKMLIRLYLWFMPLSGYVFGK